jgi:hypothetical protein
MYENNIKMDRRDIVILHDCVNWTELAQDLVHGKTFVKTVMDTQVS